MSKNKTEETSPANRDEKIINMLGLAAKAGRLIVGAEKVVDAARSALISRRDGIIIVAADAAARTKKNLVLAAEEDGVPIVEVNVDMYELGSRIGGKGLTSAVAVLDRNFASAIAAIAGGNEGNQN